MIEIFFIGTGSSSPTGKRGLPSIVLRRKGELIMFDCGEGTQLRYLKLGLGVNKNMKILITHLHGDHILGLPGLLMSFSLLGREKPLYIYGPIGLKEIIEVIFKNTKFEPTYKIKVFEITSDGILFENNEYIIRALKARHTILSFSFILEEKKRPGKFQVEKALKLGIPKGPLWKKLQQGFTITLQDGRVIRPQDVLGPPRPGFKIVYSGDTRPYEELVKFSLNADVLIHDATFPDELKERAIETGHSTISEAINTARRAKVKCLVLFHLSPRIKNEGELLRKLSNEKEFKVIIADDFLKLTLKHTNEHVKFEINKI